MHYINYTWDELNKHAYELCFQIMRSEFKPDYIVAISRGGNVLGTIISYKMDIPLIVYDPKRQKLADFKYVDWLNDKILFVDDINDSGETIEQFKIAVITTRKGYYEEGWTTIFSLDNIRFLTLFNNLTSKSTVNYSIVEINKLETPDIWINFPWEFTSGGYL